LLWQSHHFGQHLASGLKSSFMPRRRRLPHADRFGYRTHYTHAYLRRAALNCLLRAETVATGSFHESMLAILSSALTAEAYLNYAGPHLVGDWHPEVDEWLDPKRKVKRVAAGAGVRISFNGSPYRSYLRAFAIRNQIVHGRTTRVDGAWSSDLEGNSGEDTLNADWMQECTAEKARHLFDNVEVLIRQIHACIDPAEDPFLTLNEGGSSGHERFETVAE